MQGNTCLLWVTTIYTTHTGVFPLCSWVVNRISKENSGHSSQTKTCCLRFIILMYILHSVTKTFSRCLRRLFFDYLQFAIIWIILLTHYLLSVFNNSIAFNLFLTTKINIRKRKIRLDKKIRKNPHLSSILQLKRSIFA